MITEEEEQRALLEEIAEAAYEASHRSEESDCRCAECGRQVDAADGDRPILRDGFCLGCWQAAAPTAQMDPPESAPREVELGHWHVARFDRAERQLWIYKETVDQAKQLPYFDPDEYTDEELIRRVKLLQTFS